MPEQLLEYKEIHYKNISSPAKNDVANAKYSAAIKNYSHILQSALPEKEEVSNNFVFNDLCTGYYWLNPDPFNIKNSTALLELIDYFENYIEGKTFLERSADRKITEKVAKFEKKVCTLPADECYWLIPLLMPNVKDV